MKRQPLNFRYHNPNDETETIKMLADVFFAASRVKAEKVLESLAQAVETVHEEQIDAEQIA